MRKRSLAKRPRRYDVLDRLEAELREERMFSEMEEVYLPVEPCESEFGAEALERVVFDDDVYNALSESIRGERLWDEPGEESDV
jgi:hypothetical protein